jgi:hypothetical protein
VTARRVVRTCLLLCLALLAPSAVPASSYANDGPGCFMGIDVPPDFDRDPSPCVPVETPGPASGPVASGPGGGRVTVFSGSQAQIFDAGNVVGQAALPAAAIRATGFSDGSIWFSTVAGTLGQLTPDGAVHVVPTTARADGDVVEGPGGVWFASGNAVARRDADGRVRTFSTGGLRPFALTRGPDGAVWFAGGSRIGRLDENGTLKRFSTRRLNASGGIAAADGALWFTDPDRARVGRLAPSRGAVKSWPTNGYRPTRIIAGPDDRTVWYAGADYVGRMQTRTFTLADAARFRCVHKMYRACPRSIPRWPRGRSVRFTVLGPPSDLAIGPEQRIYATEGSRLAYIVPFRGPLLCGKLPSLTGNLNRVMGECARPDPTFPVVVKGVYVRLSCPRFTLRLCAGTLRLYHDGRYIGGTPYTIHSYDSPTVRVLLNRAGMRAKHEKMLVNGFIDAQDQAGLRARRWVTFYIGPHGDGIAAPVTPAPRS